MAAKNILIVDDDNAALRFVKESLELMGDFEVHTAKNGKEALALTHRVKPDLIFLDIICPRWMVLSFAKR